MKTIISILAALSLTVLPLLSFQRLVPGDHIWTYEEAHDGFMGWVIDELQAVGYDVPKEGESFCWSKYLAAVDTTDSPQKWDIVKFLDEKGESHGAIVVEIGKDGPIVKKPIADGIAIIMAIDNSQIVGYLRPHKADARDAPRI
jgi:hypothetical protein